MLEEKVNRKEKEMFKSRFELEDCRTAKARLARQEPNIEVYNPKGGDFYL